MRNIISVSALAAVVVLTACGSSAPTDESMTADLERDLALASAPRPSNAIVSALEGGPVGAPSGSEKGQRAAVAVRKRAPRPAPAAQTQEVAAPQEAAELPAPMIASTVTQSAPAPAPIAEPVQAAVPDLSVEAATESGPSAGGSGSGEEGRAGNGRRGGGWGGLIGAVIRGASVGDDHCEPRDRRNGGVGDIGRARGGRGRIGDIIQIGMGGDNRAPVGRPTYPRY